MFGATKPIRFKPGAGKTIRLGRMSMTFKTTASGRWNAYTACEAIEPPDCGAGYHRRPGYDETFFNCEGSHDFRQDRELFRLGPGDVICDGTHCAGKGY